MLSQSLWVRDRFLIDRARQTGQGSASQSLWVRDRFLIVNYSAGINGAFVAIPLGQGQVFNAEGWRRLEEYFGSQSLWVRDRFLMNS